MRGAVESLMMPKRRGRLFLSRWARFWRFRRRFCTGSLVLRPAAIRGNASGNLALSGMALGGRGVDTHRGRRWPLPAAQALARQIDCIVVKFAEGRCVANGQRALKAFRRRSVNDSHC